jgi:hypothetical protein
MAEEQVRALVPRSQSSRDGAPGRETEGCLRDHKQWRHPLGNLHALRDGGSAADEKQNSQVVYADAFAPCYYFTSGQDKQIKKKHRQNSSTEHVFENFIKQRVSRVCDGRRHMVQTRVLSRLVYDYACTSCRGNAQPVGVLSGRSSAVLTGRLVGVLSVVWVGGSLEFALDASFEWGLALLIRVRVFVELNAHREPQRGWT